MCSSDLSVVGTEVFCSKDEMVYTIYPKSDNAVKEALSKYKVVTQRYKTEKEIERKNKREVKKKLKEKSNG